MRRIGAHGTELAPYRTPVPFHSLTGDVQWQTETRTTERNHAGDRRIGGMTATRMNRAGAAPVRATMKRTKMMTQAAWRAGAHATLTNKAVRPDATPAMEISAAVNTAVAAPAGVARNDTGKAATGKEATNAGVTAKAAVAVAITDREVMDKAVVTRAITARTVTASVVDMAKVTIAVNMATGVRAAGTWPMARASYTVSKDSTSP